MKASLNDLVNLENTSAVTTINANNAVIETAFNNTLSRDGTAPNQMSAAIDMNSNQIYNLPAPSTTSSPARLIDVTSNPTIVIPGTGTSGHVVPYLDGNNTWSGKQFFNDSPWADVKAYGAVGNGSTSDDTAIQNTINHMYATYGGGTVYFPAGIYIITTGITVKGGVRLVGAGRRTTYISSFLTNVNTITFDSTCVRGCSIEHISVNGYFNATTSLVTTNAITVAQNVSIITNDVEVYYGRSALKTEGIDGCHINSWFNGCVSSVTSNGANWYIRCMFNGNGSFVSYTDGFLQGAAFGGATSQENHFVSCDFSGGPFTNALNVQGSAAAFTVSVFEGCVFGSPINILGAYWSSFIGCEFGSSSFTLNGSTGGTVSVVGCAGFGVDLTLTGNYVKAGNFRIT